MARQRKPREPKGPRLVEAPEEVLNLAARIIDENHGRLTEIGSNISYWMVNGNWRAKGETVEANATLVTGANRKESGNIFRIFINQSVWDKADAKYRAYLLDNQLERLDCSETGNGDKRWFVQDYSVKAFPSIIRRHGIMTAEMKQLDQAMHQTTLEFEKKPAA